MSTSPARSNHFIALIYEAAEDPSRWKNFCEELQRTIDVQSIHMLATDQRHGTLSYSDGANMPVEGELAYIQHYRHIDPRLPVILQRQPGEWTHCHEVLSEEDVARHPFYQEFLIPYDRRYMSATKLAEDEEAIVVFAILSSAAQGPLAGEDLAFVDELLPHLRRACRIALRSFIYASQAPIGHMLVNKLRQPVALMTPDGRVLHTNQSAEALLRATRLAQVENGKLRLPPAQLRELLAHCAALEQQAKTLGYDGVAAPGQFRSLQVGAERDGSVAGDTLYLFYALLGPQEAMGTFGRRPVVMLLFYHPASSSAIDAELLYAAFGLTPAECRVAGLLAEGLSPKEIALRQGTQHDTVRKQLRSIYQKTSTRRQPDLIRLLLHLPPSAVLA